MNLLKVIKDSDIGESFIPEVSQERGSARAVIFDEDNKIALLHVVNKNYHKLPGGGMEKGENIIEALKREAKEEIGCEIDDIQELGIIEEFRGKYKLHQLSHCFLAKIIGGKGEPNFEEDEILDGFIPLWVTLDEAIDIIKRENYVEDYEGKFIVIRDLEILQRVKDRLS